MTCLRVCCSLVACLVAFAAVCALSVSSAWAQPANDACGDAIPLPLDVEVAGTTSGAATDGLTTCGTSITAAGVWYTLTAPESGAITFSTCGTSAYDNKISVFRGSCGSLVCRGGNDDGANCAGNSAEVRIPVTGGETYLVLVHGFGTATGSFTMRATLDGDDDSDGVTNSVDNCIAVSNPLQEDDDQDGVGDACDLCAGFDDGADADTDGVPDGCDVCAAGDDTADADADAVPDACDVCAGQDDRLDADADGVPNGCDICEAGADQVDADADSVPDACDICPGSDDAADADSDGTPDGCDVCAGFDDAVDADADGVPDGCDACADADDALDADADGVPDGCDLCTGDDAAGDADEDGYCADVDCADNDDQRSPGQTEVCDGVDTDCSGSPGPDEGDANENGVADCADPDPPTESPTGPDSTDEDGGGCAVPPHPSPTRSLWLLAAAILLARTSRRR